MPLRNATRVHLIIGEGKYLQLICLREGMGLATLLHDMISLSHVYCNMLIGLLVFRHNGLIKH
uniref:Uncharacterized protein n=1 Tax=Oryza meridionalis TaxID=40149 RepID=A0A0E0EW07_9ORYZ